MSTEDEASEQRISEAPEAAERFRDQLAQKQQDNQDDDESERDLWSGGFSPKAMVGSWIATALVSVAVLVGAVMLQQSVLIGLAIVAVLWVVVGLIYAQRRLGVHYQLTSQRFIHQTGILTRKTDRIEVIDIDDVSYVQGPVQRMFGVGTITITGSDRTHPELLMYGIGNVKEVAGLIDDIRRSERRKRSLHIEAI